MTSVLTLRVAARYAKEFHTEEALKKYLKEHPKADRSNHEVIKTKEKHHKEEPSSVAGKVFHALVEPFKKAYELGTSKEARKETWGYLKAAVAKETEETKHMFRIIGDAYKGKTIDKKDRDRAIHQAVDLAKTALVTAFIGHIAVKDLSHFLASLASPLDEMLAMSLDKPLRKITEKVFGKAHGLLPSAFYGKQAGDEKALFDKLMKQILEEFYKEGFDEDSLKKTIEEQVKNGR